MDLTQNQLFAGRYRLLEEKGRGSFGEVWKAIDEHLDMAVAIKIYIALDEKGVEEFKKEFKTAYQLNHPNLLHANHFDVCDNRPYLVMPYCPSSAASLVGNCDAETLERFITDVASGLAYLHSQDIVHHDIKPDNILIGEDGHFVISDFGISTKMRGTLMRNSTRTMRQESSGGSIPYMGPEMFNGKAESVKATDIWAFGATLYEIISGELPFFGQGGVMQKSGAAVPLLDYPDKQVVRLVAACLAKDTWDRPMAEKIVHFRKNPPREKPKPKTKQIVIGTLIGLVTAAVISLWPAGWEMDQKAYEQAATDCYNLTQSGSKTNVDDLLTAIAKLEEVKKYESKYSSEAPATYNRSDKLEPELTQKCEKVATALFANAAAQANIVELMPEAKSNGRNSYLNARKLDINGSVERTKISSIVKESTLEKETGKFLSATQVLKALDIPALEEDKDVLPSPSKKRGRPQSDPENSRLELEPKDSIR